MLNYSTYYTTTKYKSIDSCTFVNIDMLIGKLHALDFECARSRVSDVIKESTIFSVYQAVSAHYVIKLVLLTILLITNFKIVFTLSLSVSLSLSLSLPLCISTSLHVTLSSYFAFFFSMKLQDILSNISTELSLTLHTGTCKHYTVYTV